MRIARPHDARWGQWRESFAIKAELHQTLRARMSLRSGGSHSPSRLADHILRRRQDRADPHRARLPCAMPRPSIGRREADGFPVG